MQPDFKPIICTNQFTNNDVISLTSKYNYNAGLTSNNKIDKNTLDRKSFYESQEYENLLAWNTILTGIYYILAIILILILFLAQNQFQLTIKERVVASFLMLVYPYVIHYFIAPINKVYQFFVGFIPTSVYNNI